MDIITTSLEALIQRATNVNNQGPDTAAIDAFCGLINKEPECAQIAAKFITAKVHSLQEWEALQALLVLENCMKRCGSVFHAEAGKFRFLNELIKLVSPKYMGAHTPEPVRRRVLELMHCWTVQFPREVKIKEAYDMLKKQGVVKEDPPMAPVASQSRHPPPSILQDEEKSQLLQKLLQSKNPDDLQAANRLIKNMVKEDERRLEEKWRHAVELETAVNNCRLLNEMLDSLEGGSSSEQDLELIRELQATCLSLRPVLFKLATTNAEPPFCQSVLMANDELGDVLTRYQSLVKTAPPADLHRTDTSSAGHGNSMPLHPDAPSSSLLDLTPSSANPPPSALDSMSQQLSQLGLELERSVAPPSTQVSYMASLEDIFASPANLPDSALLPPLVSSYNNCGDKSVPSSNKERTSSKLKGFKELDLLGKSLLEETLSQAKNAQNNKPVKVSMNEMSMPAPLVADPEMRRPSLLLDDDLLLVDSAEAGQPVVGDDSPIAAPDDVLLVATQSSAAPTPNTNSTSDTKTSKADASPDPPPPLPLADINITLDSIKPSSVAPVLPLEDKNGMSLAIFLARERPRPDVSVFVVTVTSKNQSPLCNFLFQPVVPKSCRVRLLAASSSVLPAHNPFLPPSAITQIMLIASSTKEPISLKFVISYVMEEETFTELGEIDRLPLLDL